jgi:pentapeptide MXKDX repeat protein
MRSRFGPPTRPGYFSQERAWPSARSTAICGDRAANFKDAPNPGPRSQSREVRTMTSRLKFLVPAAACLALGGVAFVNVALAEDAPAKPDAMTADHMSGDHMAPMKKTHMKKHMMKGDHMMAPVAPK